MFDDFPQSDFQIIAPDGTSRGGVKGIFGSKMITIPDAKATILVEDELRRLLPNGTEEAFEVLDPAYHADFGGIPAHYQVKIQRRGAFPRGQGGNYNINISGANARFNVNSIDNSHNVQIAGSLFGDLRSAIETNVVDPLARQKLLSEIGAMEAVKDDKGALAKAYQGFIASAAEHMTVIAPFLPALGQLFG